MSLVTTCPECKTAFVIKPEHLAAHRGDVRCGHCHHLFNALAHLAEAAPAEEVHVTPAPPEAPVEEPSFDAPLGTDLSTDRDPTLSADHASDELAADAFVADEPTLTIDTTELDFVLETDPEPVAEDIPAMTKADETPYPALIDPDLVVTPPTPKIVRLESANNKGGFLSQTPPKRRSTFWLLGVLALLLLLGAAAQTTYFLRTEIAIRLPQTKPWLVQACASLGCTVELPRQIDQLVIDDSNLQEDAEHEGIVLLTSTLINRAHFAQAYPQLELTLTDLDDHAVLRRTFTPLEYLPKGSDIAVGMPVDEEIHVKLALFTNAIKAAGYRVFITYP